MTGELLDRLTHHVHILKFNGESYRLQTSKGKWRQTKKADKIEAVDPTTGEISAS